MNTEAARTTTPHDDTPAQAGGSSFSWVAHPAREQPGRLIVAVIWIAATMLVVFATTNSVFWAALTIVVLVFALNRFFVPSAFELDEEGITARYPLRTRRYEWREIRRFAHDSDGGYLSTRAVPSRLDAHRGMHLLFGTCRTEAINEINLHLVRMSPSGELAARASAELTSRRESA